MYISKVKIPDGEILNIKDEEARNNIENINTEIDLINYKLNKGISIHISFDDVENCLSNLQNNNYTSIFDEPFLNKLKELHDTYGACFSLYVYTNVFNSITKTSYKNEFKENCKWLKIGYHSPNATDNMSIENYLSAKTKYNTFVTNVIRICGTNEIIDRVPRLNNFVAPITSINGVIDANCGVIGLLDADDNRISYNHNQIVQNYINTQYEYFDNVSQLFFIKTNIRIENSTNLANDLENIYNSVLSKNRNIEIFTHEWYLYDGTNLNNINKLEQVCQWANTNNIPFDFVQNKLPNMTGNRLIKPYTKSPYYRNNIPISLGQNVMINNSSIDNLKLALAPQANGAGFNAYIDNTRMGCKCLLIAPSTHIIELHNSIEGLQYAIGEYTTDYPGYNNYTPNGMQNNEWINVNTGITQITLQDLTKYYTIMFKKSDNSEFTQDDVNFNNVYVIQV